MPRLDKTLADYIAIAISPVLIMLMVGSLMYFLVAVCYVGRYEMRLYWILGCFTVAIVLISRISIEDGQQRAILFGAVLAGVTGLAVMRFANVFFLPWLLLALAWWSASKLTWDCTLIDEDQDSSGQGLMQIVKFRKNKGTQRADDAKGGPTDESEKADVAEPEGVTARVSDMRTGLRAERQPAGRSHAPGVWIVYFSLAALPLFGLGQLRIPTADVGRRQWAFTLLCCYVGAGLGLLVTTSFLGLRRYLRQRGVAMPGDMAAVWIGLGAAMIVVLLFLVALLPRPAAEYAISQFPLTFTTPERESSRRAVGSDGADENAPDSDSRVTDEEEQDEPAGSETQKDTDSQPPSDEGESGEGRTKESGEPSSEKSDSSKQKQSDQSQQREDGDRQKEPSDRSDQADRSERPESQSDDKNESEESPSGERNNRDSQQAEKSTDEQEQQRESDQRDPDDPEAKPDEQQRDASESRSEDKETSDHQRQRERDEEPREKQKESRSKSSSEPSRPPSRPSPQLPHVSTSLGGIFKLIIYALLLGVVGYVLWKSRGRVWAAILQFLQELRDFWASLFGGKKSPGDRFEEAVLKTAPQRPFSDYHDPFASGMVGQHPAEQIVRYTFEALEAWARERGCPRELDQTPREFARQVRRRFDSLSGGVSLLAGLYSQVAYARGRLDARSIEPLAQLWEGMKTVQPRPFAMGRTKEN